MSCLVLVILRNASALKNFPNDSLTTRDFVGGFNGSSDAPSLGVCYCKLVKLDFSFLARESFCVGILCILFELGFKRGDLLGELVPSLNIDVGLSRSILTAMEPMLGKMPSISPSYPILPLLILSCVKG